MVQCHIPLGGASTDAESVLAVQPLERDHDISVPAALVPGILRYLPGRGYSRNTSLYAQNTSVPQWTSVFLASDRYRLGLYDPVLPAGERLVHLYQIRHATNRPQQECP